MMTLAEVHLLTDRRIAAIRWTLDSLEEELAKLVVYRREQKRNAVSHLVPPAMPDSRKSEMADS